MELPRIKSPSAVAAFFVLRAYETLTNAKTYALAARNVPVEQRLDLLYSAARLLVLVQLRKLPDELPGVRNAVAEHVAYPTVLGVGMSSAGRSLPTQPRSVLHDHPEAQTLAQQWVHRVQSIDVPSLPTPEDLKRELLYLIDDLKNATWTPERDAQTA